MNSLFDFNPLLHKTKLIPLLRELDRSDFSSDTLHRLLRKYPKDKHDLFTKSQLISAHQYFHSLHPFQTPLSKFRQLLQKKPTRTQSGVAVVTTLTKPFPCPGKCIFCPSDVRMPKSYLSSEPGAQRAAHNAFDPYLQTYNRLLALKSNGHDTSKIELIILGGTWSYYPRPYQRWYIKRSFDALNDFGLNLDARSEVVTGYNFKSLKSEITPKNSTTTYNQIVSKQLVDHRQASDPKPKSLPPTLNSWEHATWQQLKKTHLINQTNPCRCVGLVIETRPDNISASEVNAIRRLGATKTQIGIQSLQDKVLRLNKRGHTVAATRRAFQLLRAGGFKIQAHWMPNLYGSTPELDLQDYKNLFSDPDFKPDELKIYPCSLIASAELMSYHQQGLWQPYTRQQLLELLTQCLQFTPPYCRITRMIRDISGDDIVVGNKITNFRQLVEQHLINQKIPVQEIRFREIKNNAFDPKLIKLDTHTYQTSISTEKFLQFITPNNKILAFLRLSLPKINSNETIKQWNNELNHSAIIREVHVYGQVVGVGKGSGQKAQHLGLGKKLIKHAIKLARVAHYPNLAVISAIGTREYYSNLGFKLDKLYQHYRLTD